jgi:hypothetical protein
MKKKEKGPDLARLGQTWVGSARCFAGEPSFDQKGTGYPWPSN